MLPFHRPLVQVNSASAKSKASMEVPLMVPNTRKGLFGPYAPNSVVVSSISNGRRRVIFVPIWSNFSKSIKEMNLELTEEHIAVRDAARDFAQNVLKPTVIDRDNEQRFATEEIKELGALGFMGMMVDEKYGGSGMDTISYVLAMEEISKVDASVSVCMSVNNSLVCYGLQAYGTEEQSRNTCDRSRPARKSEHFA